jgi:hypothetical protein
MDFFVFSLENQGYGSGAGATGANLSAAALSDRRWLGLAWLVRRRLLPVRLTMIFTFACWLFMWSGHGLVMSKLADAHAMSGPGWGLGATTGPISRAMARLGAEPLKPFDRVAAPVGTAGTSVVFCRDLRGKTKVGGEE